MTATEAETTSAVERRWYIVHTYSGFEERVKETLLQRADGSLAVAGSTGAFLFWPEPALPPRAEVPGLSYYTPAPANLPQRPALPLTALDQMYAYWTRD